MNKEQENYLWNVIYGNTGYTHFKPKEKEKARNKLFKWFKSKEYNELKGRE